MSKIKLIVVGGIVLAAGVLSPAAKADPTLDLYAASASPYQNGVGGEFTAVTSGFTYGDYAASTVVNVVDPYTGHTVTGFQTFCVQTGVDFTPYNWGNPTPYNFSLSLNSIGNSHDGHASGSGSPDNYPLSVGTAWLYAEFATGHLTGYDFGNDSARLSDAGLLQEAIWTLQGNQSYSGQTMPSNDPYYQAALTQFGSLANATAAATSSDNYGVEIMNLYSGNGPASVDNAAQNQLVYTELSPTPYNNTPDSGASLGLMALGLAGLAVFARRLGATQAS